MTAEQAATLKRLAEATYELEAFQPNLALMSGSAEVDFFMNEKSNMRSGRHSREECHNQD